jgi:protease-4
MGLETDLLLDRRRLKRRLWFWRVLAVVAVVGCAALVVGHGIIPGGRAHIARLTVSGVITDQPRLIKEVDKLADDGTVKALIVAIDSPGGSVAGGEGLHDAIAKVAAKKPVVAVMGGMAASAGYMIAVPAARIFAREGTLTGSIGVLLETGEVSGLLHMLGVSTDAIVSGPLKDQPSFTKPMTPQGRAVLQGIVMDLYDQFVAMVAQGRHLDEATVRQLGDGRAYTGRQALKLGLIDQIGGEEAARAWLAAQKGISADLPVRDLDRGGWTWRLLRDVPGGFLGGMLKNMLSQGLNLDGAWALWQPSLTRD